jgi:outer membrane receptor protein involved in Fe transport
VARTDIVAYEDFPYNAEPYWTRNLDVSASYNLTLDGGGSMNIRLLGTRALEQSRCLQTERSADGTVTECLTRQNVVGITGSGGGTPGFSSFSSQPKWAGNVYASYSKQAFSITGQARYTGKGLQSLGGFDIDDPGFQWNMYNTTYRQSLPSWTTFNLTTSYNFARSRFAPERFENLQLSLTIDNLFDKQPDFYSCSNCTGGVNTRFYNGNGRTFRLNLRSAF